VSLLAASCETAPTKEAEKEKRKPPRAAEKPAVEASSEKESEIDTLELLLTDSAATDTTLGLTETISLDEEASDSSASELDNSDVAMEAFPIEDYSEAETGFDDYSETDAIFYEADDYLETERLLSTEVVKVITPDPKSQKDSVLTVIESRLSLSDEEVSEVIIVEKWLSPVHYKGYRFNKKKLILYGANKSTSVRLFYYTQAYYLGLNNTIYHLEERIEYSPLETVKDSALANYFNKYEAPL